MGADKSIFFIKRNMQLVLSFEEFKKEDFCLKKELFFRESGAQESFFGLPEMEILDYAQLSIRLTSSQRKYNLICDLTNLFRRVVNSDSEERFIFHLDSFEPELNAMRLNLITSRTVYFIWISTDVFLNDQFADQLQATTPFRVFVNF